MTSVAERVDTSHEHAGERRDDDRLPVLLPGAEVAPGYEVVMHIRRGNALDVYDIWSEERDCRCVAKLPRPDRLQHEGIREDLLLEGRLLQSMSHPHLVRAYETVEQPYPVVILEALTGDSLRTLIEQWRRRRLAATPLAILGIHLCSAMAYLHRHGYVHLDLKPSNIASACGIAKVLDLSLAVPPGTHVKAGVGTLDYLSPEQARGGRVDERADVWGIGLVLYEAASGVNPFEPDEDEDDDERCLQLEDRAPPVRRHRRLPAELAAAIDACLEPEPNRRPQVEELAQVLERFMPFPRRGYPADEEP